jgi:hypothetical protein
MNTENINCEIYTAGNYLILAGLQRRIIGAEMIANRHAVDNRSKLAAEVADMISSVALFDHEMVAR